MLVFSIFFSAFYLSDINAYDNIAQLYDSTYGQDGNNAEISIDFDTQGILQSNYTHNTGVNNERLYVNETATYKVSYSCTWEAQDTGDNDRRLYQNKVRINGGTNVVPSESIVYIRNPTSGEGDISATSATVLINLTDGDYIELRGGEDSANSNNGPTDTIDSCYLTAQRLNTRTIEVYDGSGGQDIRSSPVVNMNKIYYNGDPGLYSLASDQVTVSEDGWYKVSYTSCIEQIGGGASSQRQSPQSWLRKNGNTNITLSFSFAGYTRDNDNDRDKNCNRATTLVNLSNGDYLELQTGIYSRDTDQRVDTLANQGWMIIEKILQFLSIYVF